MGSTTVPAASTGQTTYTQSFTSSGTWVAPSTSTYNGIATVTVVGAGGGGGGGGGGTAVPLTSTSSNYIYGGAGGGGGGGGQVIYQRQVLVPAGTSVPITIGAGGAGGITDSTGQTYNYIANPMINSGATTYWASGTNATVSRVTTPLPVNNASATKTSAMQVAFGATTGIAWSYDSGNNSFTVPTTAGQNGYVLGFAIASSSTSQTYNFTIGVSWYANASLIRTDTVSTSFTSSGTANTYTGGFITNFNSSTYPIPLNATRLVINFSSGSATSATNWFFTEMFLLNSEYWARTVQTGACNTRYIDPSYQTSFAGSSSTPLYWSGTANSSVTMVRGGYGMGFNGGNQPSFTNSNDLIAQGAYGARGNNGGNTSFGTYVTAYGGGAGGGGDWQNQTYNCGGTTSSGTNFIGKVVSTTNPGAGGNGGGSGQKYVNTTSGQSRQSGSGGGGAGGWASLIAAAVNSSWPVSGNLSLQGGYGLQNNGSNMSVALNALPNPQAGTQNASTTIFAGYTPSIGGQGLYGYGAGGDGGNEGYANQRGDTAGTGNFNQTMYLTYNSSLLPQDKSLGVTWPSTPGGNGGTTLYASSGGTANNGSAGTNGVNYGDGGGGGGGGGSSTSTTLSGSTIANPGNGGNGGNGANGIVIVTWSA